jgi:AraC-like DNA-binding protein
MAPVCGLPELLSANGLDADAFIRARGCNPELFADPNNTIEFRAIGRLLAEAAAATGCAYPGLALGRLKGLDVVGPIGRAMRLAPDIGTALRTMILHMHLHERGSVPYTWTAGGQALFGYTLCGSDLVGTDHIYDGALAISLNFLRELAGPGWRATEVRMFRDPPEDTVSFREHFQAPLRFNAHQAAVVFPAADLKRPCVNADAEKYAEALADLASLDAETGSTLADKVHRVLLRLLVTGVNVGGAAPDRAAVAELFAMHPRTLNRRLTAAGTSFAHLLARARYDVARELLRDTQLPVQDIALVLGYSGTGPFTHAFRRWSGTTAARWRETHGRA